MAVSFKLNVNVKVVEMGDASTSQLPCIPLKIVKRTSVQKSNKNEIFMAGV